MNVNFNTESAIVEIELSVFIDDIQKAIESNTENKLRLGTERELEHSDELLFDYIRKHITILVDGKDLDYSFVGKELGENDLNVLWLYLSAENVKSVSVVKIENNLLIELYEEQENFVSVKKGKSKHSKRLIKGYSSTEFSF